MKSTITGQLTQTSDDPDFFESLPIPIPFFAGKEMTVGFVAANDESYMEGADKVLADFLSLTDLDRQIHTESVFNYYSQTLQAGYTSPLPIKTKSDIWDYVTPKYVLIDQDENSNYFVVFECDCEWEEEHGLCLAFKNGLTLTKASGYDGHYTD